MGGKNGRVGGMENKGKWKRRDGEEEKGGEKIEKRIAKEGRNIETVDSDFWLSPTESNS